MKNATTNFKAINYSRSFTYFVVSILCLFLVSSIFCCQGSTTNKPNPKEGIPQDRPKVTHVKVTIGSNSPKKPELCTTYIGMHTSIPVSASTWDYTVTLINMGSVPQYTIPGQPAFFADYPDSVSYLVPGVAFANPNVSTISVNLTDSSWDNTNNNVGFGYNNASPKCQ